MNKKILIVFLLSVLVIMSFVQGVQINNLKEAVEEGSGFAGSESSSNNAYSKPAAPVPSMVGGC